MNRAVLADVALAAFPVGFAISRIRTTASVVEPFAPGVPERLALDQLTKNGVGGFPLDVVIDAGKPDSAFDESVIRQANLIEKALRSSSNVSTVISPVTIIRHLKCRYGRLRLGHDLPRSDRAGRPHGGTAILAW